MEVTALCFRLLTTVLLLQVEFSYSFKAVSAFPQVFPNSQQFFKHESFNISCEGLGGRTGWRVMRSIRGLTKTCAATWGSSVGPCLIETSYPQMDTGTYWCEMGKEKSQTVNITVTAGPVILESPVLAVTEGDAVTLICRNKQPSNFTADFYKDGSLMERSSAGNFTISSVSTSNGGLYRCTMGAEESPESWMTVSSSSKADEDKPQDKDEPQDFLLISIGVCVFLFVLLLLVGLLRCRKRQMVPADAPNSASTHLPISTPQTESNETSEDVSFQPTYAAVTITKPTEEKDEDESSFVAVYHTLSLSNSPPS